MKGWTSSVVKPKDSKKKPATSTSQPKPTTEPPQETEARHEAKIELSQSAQAKLKPRYYKATHTGFPGNKYTIIDLPDELVPAFEEAMRRVGVKEA